jgi:hypothetical protein
MCNQKLLRLVFPVVFLLAAFESFASTFSNGGFETPAISGVAQGLNPGDTWLTGWTIGGPGGNMGLYRGSTGGISPHSGQQWVYFGGISTASGGTLSQTFTTVSGTSYVVTYYAVQAGSPATLNLSAAAYGTGGLVLASNQCVPVNVVWNQYQLSFTATSNSTTLSFIDTSPADISGSSVALDDVTVVAQPTTGIPVIVTSPVSQSALAGSDVSLSATASGSLSTLQWYFGTNVVAPPNGTNSPLVVIANASTAGNYTAVFSNSFGMATSVVAVLTVTNAPILVNGSFEIPAISGSAQGLNPGDTWLTDWTVGGPGGNMGLYRGSTGGISPYDGQQWVYFGGVNTASGGTLSQTLATVPGISYTVTYHAVEAGSPASLNLSATASNVGSGILASNRCTPVYVQWNQYELGFTATSTGTVLTFTDSSPSDVSGSSVVLDDVTVVAQPTTGIPIIEASPVSQSAPAGSSVSLTATASGSPSSIQWYFGTNVVAAPEGTNSPLVVTASDATAGNYMAVFSNSYGMATTAVAALTVIDPPAITTSPSSQSVAAGTQVTFTAAASGGWTTVQWYFVSYLGTNAISGANTTNLPITASTTTIGGYFAVFNNLAGSTSTSLANLAVTGLNFENGSFEIPVEPNGGTGLNPGNTFLTGWTIGGPGGNMGLYHGSVTGLGPYDGQQWVYFGGINTASGGTLAQTFTTVVGDFYAVTYYVGTGASGTLSLTGEVLDAAGNVLATNQFVAVHDTWTERQLFFVCQTTNTTVVFKDTSAADILGTSVALDDVTVVGAPNTGIPVVLISPVSQTVATGSVVSLVSTAGGSPSSLQWYFGTNAVAGAAGTASPLQITASDATAGSYTVVFSNSYGMATSAVAVLTVIDPPVVTVSPANQVVVADTTVTLSAAASGGAMTVQWRYNGTNVLSGATSTNLSFLAVPGTAGSYSAIFNNLAGSATSMVATVTVIAGPFTNGGFENINNHAAIPNNNGAFITNGSTWLTGWTVGGPGTPDIDVDRGSSDGFTAFDGQQWIAFNGGNTPPGGVLSQTFLTTVGATYGVSFQVGKAGSGSQSLTATALALNGAVLASNYCVPTMGVWAAFSLNFTATTTNTTLVFKDTSSTTVGADLMLDDVIVVSPPVITVSPASQSVLVGSLVTFTAAASGTPSGVQWFQGTNAVLNATNSTLSFTANAGSGGNYSAVFTNSAGSATTAVAVLTVDLPVGLSLQPVSIVTNVGATVTLTGGASGTAPIGFQWTFDGTNITGANSTNLVITNAQLTNAGSYALVVTNAYGTNTSTNAVLSLISTIQVAGGSTVGAGSVTVPVNLLALGTENAVGFSLDYDASVLTYSGVSLGSGGAGAALITNSTFAGKLGITVILPPNTTFSAGTQQLVQVTFQAALVSTTVHSSITFGGLPTSELVSDPSPAILPALYLPGLVTVLPTPLEGDVYPIGAEDFSVSLLDWVQEGRYVAGLDAITDPQVFQRADCAPRSTLGDGLITVADWVQVGRYYNNDDPPTPAGGPTNAPAAPSAVAAPSGKRTGHDGVPRTVTLAPLTQGTTTESVSVKLVAQGDESALQFSVAYDPTVLTYTSASLGSNAVGASLIVNTNYASSGRLGIVVGYLGGTFTLGTQEVVKLNFNSISYSNTTSLVFGNSPIIQQIVDTVPNVLPATYQNASVQVGGQSWPQLAISQSVSGISFSWPSSATALKAQWTTNLGTNWTDVAATAVTNGGTVYLTVPAPSTTTFYRLSQ